MGRLFFIVIFLIGLLQCSAAAGEEHGKLVSVGWPPVSLKYHNGLLLRGRQTVSLLWYGGFSPENRAIITLFLHSLSASGSGHGVPTVSSWWSTTAGYVGSPPEISLVGQFFDDSCSMGRRLNASSITQLARRAAGKASMAVVLTSMDVTVDGFCVDSCASHNWLMPSRGEGAGFPFIWVGNPELQCPQTCMWPFYNPPAEAGSQPRLPLTPLGDPAIYSMLINIAGMLAGAVTNPDGNGGYFQGSPTAPAEAVTACAGIFGSGAYPGYPGKVIVDPATGASYNAIGVAGHKYLLPAMWDPDTSQCKTAT